MVDDVVEVLDVSGEVAVDVEGAVVAASVVFAPVLDAVDVGAEVTADDVTSKRLGMSQAATSPTVAAEEREIRLEEAMLKMYRELVAMTASSP